MTYEPFGPLKQATLGNTLSMTNSWGNDARLASRRLYVTSGGVNRSLLTYAYDNDDNITGITDGVDATKSVTYGYDAMNRLAQSVAASGSLRRTDYGHDANGNRTSVARRVNAGDATPAESDSYTRTPGTNRLASVTMPSGTRSIAYDNRGNPSSEARPGSVSVTTAYDGHARLISYTRTGDPNLSHIYNGLDDRVATTRGTDTRRFMTDPDGRAIGEYGTSAADVKAEFIWMSAEVANDNQSFGGDDGTGGYAPLAVVEGTTLKWVHGNHLGVPVTMTDAAGTVLTLGGDYMLPGFPGQLRTFADLYYNRYRDYDTTTGRYIQADPIGLAGGANAYLYAEANPLKYVDPSGQCPWCVAVIAGAVIGAGIDLGLQALENWHDGKKLTDPNCYNWWSVGASAALGAVGGGVGTAGRTASKGREFSHWIPERYWRPLTKGGNPNPTYKPWLDNPTMRRFLDSNLNGNFVTSRFHSLTDPYRYLSGMTKANNFAAPIQQVLRVPTWTAVPASGAAIVTNASSEK
jgi:RHS repeat-associated protein